jgi:UDP-N-acetylmuramyl tripeptide synthase
VFATGESYPLALHLPGRCNQANAVMTMAGVVGAGGTAGAAVGAMAGVQEVAGRYATFELEGVRARLLLAKNPAGWAEVFDMLAPAPAPVVIAINARTADGHDPSWLWDVPFEALRGRPAIATGERGRRRGPDGDGGSTVDVVANYTSFHQLMARLGPGAATTRRAGAIATDGASAP